MIRKAKLSISPQIGTIKGYLVHAAERPSGKFGNCSTVSSDGPLPLLNIRTPPMLRHVNSRESQTVGDCPRNTACAISRPAVKPCSSDCGTPQYAAPVKPKSSIKIFAKRSAHSTTPSSVAIKSWRISMMTWLSPRGSKTPATV